ncbi:ankyrin repeat, SAM and basic leucine zipper domain-containing protein 1 [Folsomia candida]|nr:ankyrin repeat, SAM and basic leucine zipper domain-containing protein 1 [Folsomia candida]
MEFASKVDRESAQAEPPRNRPAGESESDGEGFDIFPKPAIVPANTNERIHYDEDEWGSRNNAAYSSSQAILPEPVVISASESARIACSRGEIDKVQKLLDDGSIQINCFLPDDTTLLITAAAYAYPSLVKFLIERGADVTQFSHGLDKTTPLIAAVSCTRPSATEDHVLACVKLLVEKGSPLNTQGHSALTALVIAIKRRQERHAVSEYLLQHGANPDVQDFAGRTPLFHAAEVGDGKSCRLLLEHNANVNIIDDNGWSCLDVAGDKGFNSLSELLYKVRTTKWKPGQDPVLMKEIKDVIIGRGRVSKIREDSQIEMLLRAINAEKYKQNFRHHKVTYLQFLQFDEEDLKAVGIEEVGIRKKVMESIREAHSTGWARSWMNMMSVNKRCTGMETVCIVNNINFHVEHIQNTIHKLTKRILKDPTSLRLGKERSDISGILSRLKDLDKNNFILHEELLKMKQLFVRLKNNAELQIGDKFELEPKDMQEFLERWNAVKKDDKKESSDGKKWVLFGVTSALLVTAIAWKSWSR